MDNQQCSKCGRVFKNLPSPRKCSCGCSMFRPYNYTLPACVRKGNPECPAKAVIAHKTVEHRSSMVGICNAYVHVTDINTTFYLNERGEPIVIWAGPVTTTEYDLEKNPLRLRNQFVSTTDSAGHSRLIFYDAQGEAKMFVAGVPDAWEFTLADSRKITKNVLLEES